MKDDNMPAARPEFIHLSEAEVWSAIDDDGGPVAAEVTRLVAAFTIRLLASVDRSGPAPCAMFQVCVRCPIERVALLMMVEEGVGVSLVTVN